MTASMHGRRTSVPKRIRPARVLLFGRREPREPWERPLGLEPRFGYRDALEGPKRYVMGVRAGITDPAPEALANRTPPAPR